MAGDMSAIFHYYCIKVCFFEKKFGSNKKRFYICITKRIMHGKVCT